jgi:hypothetical protein
MKLTLNTLYKNREVILKRCKKNDACKGEYRRLSKAKNNKEFKKVILENLYWCKSHEIIPELFNSNSVWKYIEEYIPELDMYIFRDEDDYEYGLLNGDLSVYLKPTYESINAGKLLGGDVVLYTENSTDYRFESIQGFIHVKSNTHIKPTFNSLFEFKKVKGEFVANICVRKKDILKSGTVNLKGEYTIGATI